MRWLIKYWNQNRKQIILIIAFIAFIFIIIQITNHFLENKENQRAENQARDPYKPSQSVLTGEVVSEEITEKNTQIIEQFVEFCNQKEYENAFGLLSDDCKEIVFNNDVNLFISNYYNINFQDRKTYNLELWMNTSDIYTYQITYYQDNILATGGENMGQNTEDYISIVKQKDEEKLNINGFIKKINMNQSIRQGDVEIAVNSRIIYKNYETYNITAGNYSNETVLLSDRQDNKKICLVDNRDVEYSSFIYENGVEELTLKPGYANRIQIRFNKMYHMSTTIKAIKFQDIILNHNTNIENENLQKISIEIPI